LKEKGGNFCCIYKRFYFNNSMPTSLSSHFSTLNLYFKKETNRIWVYEFSSSHRLLTIAYKRVESNALLNNLAPTFLKIST